MRCTWSSTRFSARPSLPRYSEQISADPGVVDRMRIEAQALGALSHPNIVSVTDFGETAHRRPFYVMERLEGDTIGTLLRRRTLPPLIESLQIVRQVLDALGAAHGLGLVHRDIKPDNVFLHRAPDGRKQVKVLDFGIAKVLSTAPPGSPAPAAIPTADGTVIGTPRYLSPEQISARGVDHRADLYAVGLLLYALVDGAGPFDGIRGTKELFEAHLKRKPAPLALRHPDLPAALDRAVLCALEKRPEDRFSNAAEFASALADIARDVTHDLVARPSTRQASAAAAKTEVTRRVSGTSDTLLDPTEPAAWLGDPTTPDIRFAKAPSPGEVREPTEVLPAGPGAKGPAMMEPVSTRTAQPRQASMPARVGEAVPSHPEKRLDQGVTPYVVGALVTGVLMCTLVFFVGSISTVGIFVAAAGSAAVGAGVVLFLSQREGSRQRTPER